MSNIFEAIGFTRDGEKAAFQVQTTEGPKVLEIPLGQLPMIAHVLVCTADAGAKQKGEEFRAPTWSTAMWGVGSQGNTIALQIHTMRSGSYRFGLDRDTALKLSEGLREASGLRVQHTQKPN